VKLAAEATLGTSKIEAADALVTIPPGDLSDVLSYVGRKLTHGANNDVYGDGEVVASKSKTFAHGLHNTTKAETFVDVKNRTETDLQVPNTIVPAVFADFVHDTGQSIRSLKNFQSDVKATKILYKRRAVFSNTHKLLQFLLIESRQLNTLLLGKFNDGTGTNTTIQMLVKLRLGKLTHHIICNLSLGSHILSTIKQNPLQQQKGKDERERERM